MFFKLSASGLLVARQQEWHYSRSDVKVTKQVHVGMEASKTVVKNIGMHFCRCLTPHTEWKGVVESEFVHHAKRLDNLTGLSPNNKKNNNNNNNNNTQVMVKGCSGWYGTDITKRLYVPICKVYTKGMWI